MKTEAQKIDIASRFLRARGYVVTSPAELKRQANSKEAPIYPSARAMMRMPAVMAETGNRSHASIYNHIKAGLFTDPVKIGDRSVGWPSDEVNAICAARIAGQTDEQIRELVISLHARRLVLFVASGA